MEEKYVSTGKAARLAKVSFATIKRMIYAGKLKAEQRRILSGDGAFLSPRSTDCSVCLRKEPGDA